MRVSESGVMRRFIQLVILSLVASVVLMAVFRAELSEALYDSLTNNTGAVKRTWSREMGGALALRPERNDPLFLRVDGLRAGVPSTLGVPVSFELANFGEANDFPNIAVSMAGADGRPLRRIVYSPQDYSHSHRFEKQHVELVLQPGPREVRFTVQVFYGELR